MSKLVGVTPVSAPISPGLDSRNTWPTHKAEWGQGGLKVVADTAARDAIAEEHRYQSMALVMKDDDGFTNCFHWTGKREDGTDGAWAETSMPGGIIVADTNNGALSKRVKTLVLGPDFSVEEAGDQEGGALVKFIGKTGGGYVNVHLASPNERYGNAQTNEVTVLPPLNVWDDPDIEHGVKLEVKPGTFEPMHSPSFLAYLSEEEEVISHKTGATAHDKGAIWFDDIVWPAGPYIETKRSEKVYGIQEADELDPNITGGMDYLVAFRAGMVGTAPSDGFVRAYLYNSGAVWKPDTYMLDKNGQPLIVERHYKAGDKLGMLDIMGIVNAKGLKEFRCHVVHNFKDNPIVLGDRAENPTGLMIQALKKDSKTGMALLQFQSDTKQSIVFNSHYLGEGLFDLTWVANYNLPITEGEAGTGQTMNDGTQFYNISDMKIGAENGHVVLEDNGSDVCDFNFGKIFSSERTLMLRERDINVTVTLTDKDAGWDVALMKWIGKPDEYTKEIFKSRNNGTPVFQTNWVKSDSLFISEDAVSGDHTVTKTFQVPPDAVNYAVIIYPANAQQPLSLKLKQLKVDVKEPFYGYVLHAPELLSEQHLTFSDKYKQFSQDNDGYAGLRYTINDTPSGNPMPCGRPRKGLADISLDDSVNQVVGSSAKGGEGAIKFNADGTATINTQVQLWNEETTSNTATFWWDEIGPDGSSIKIADSETTVTVASKAQKALYSMREFTIDVEAGDRIALKARSDKADGAYIESTSPSEPSVKVDLMFKEMVPVAP